MRSSSKIDLPLSHQYRTENFERYAKVKEIEERTVYAKRRKESWTCDWTEFELCPQRKEQTILYNSTVKGLVQEWWIRFINIFSIRWQINPENQTNRNENALSSKIELLDKIQEKLGARTSEKSKAKRVAKRSKDRFQSKKNIWIERKGQHYYRLIESERDTQLKKIEKSKQQLKKMCIKCKHLKSKCLSWEKKKLTCR